MSFFRLIGFEGDQQGEPLDAMCTRCYKTFSGASNAVAIDNLAASHECDDFDLIPLMQPSPIGPSGKNRIGKHGM